MADPKTKDEDQNAIPPETDWPSPNIRPPRQWSVGLKQFISNFLYVVITISVLILVPTIIFGCFYLLGDIISLYTKTDDPDQFTKLRNSLFILAALIGAPFLVWRTWIASKQANTAQEKAYTELFTQAIEQLGSVKPVGKDQYEENIEVRVGALYALERIMHDSDKDAKTIIDTLCTYVKHHCGKPKIFEDEISKTELEKLSEDEIRTKRDEFIETLNEAPPADRYDIQTALTIIGRRPGKYKTEETMPDLSNVNLQGANLGNFDLSLCNLANAHLEGVKLKEANLQKSNLLMADLQRAFLYEANLQGAFLQGANLQEAKLQEAELQEANLLGANLYGADLQWAKLQEAKLQRAKLERADLQCANLDRADLEGAYLQEAKLKGAKLQRAKLQGAKLQDVQITDADKTAASVIYVNFTKAKYDFDILQEQVMDMFGHKTLTILPDGMKVPDHWSEVDMDTAKGREQYESEWEAFKKEKGVE